MDPLVLERRLRRRAAHRRMFETFYKYRTGQDPPVDYRLPLPGPPPEMYIPGVPQMTYKFYNSRRRRFNIDGIVDRNAVPERFLQAWERVQLLKDHFANRYPGLRYRKCLGWGGNGLASAFDEIDENGRKVRSYVAKVLFRDVQELLSMETDCLMQYLKAEHIVQLVYRDGDGVIGDEAIKKVFSKADAPPAPAAASAAVTGKKRPRAADDDGDNGDMDDAARPPPRKKLETAAPALSVFITEMLENGDLTSFICRVNNHRERVPNAVLWRFLLCLVRMCIAMAYPPLSLPKNKDVAGPITETVPGEQGREYEKRMVHFDFDPSNIFVGDLELGAEHQIAPLLKLGDFGLATEVQYARKNEYYERLRHYGKQGYYSPEQFCADWDYIKSNSGTIHTHHIAGNYGPHTNVWAIGYVMDNLITGCWPAEPPKPTRTGRWPPEYADEYWTYGAHLEQARYGHVDPQLIDVVLRCLAHMPRDRPTLRELEILVKQVNDDRYGDDDGDDDVADAETLAWVQKILHEPPTEPDISYMPIPVVPPPPTPGARRRRRRLGREELLGDGMYPVPAAQGVAAPAVVAPAAPAGSAALEVPEAL